MSPEPSRHPYLCGQRPSPGAGSNESPALTNIPWRQAGKQGRSCARGRTLCGLVLVSAALATSALAQTNSPAQQVRHFQGRIQVTVQYDYLLFLPEGYGSSKKRWPLMLFLHGAGEAGTNVLKVKALGPPKIVETKPDFPFVLVSPQNPDRGGWDPEKLNALLDSVLHKYRVDPDRVYLTGASMGGNGAWALAAAHPEKFAAVVPVSSSGNPAYAPKLVRLPIWAFNRAGDPVVHLERAQATIQAVQAAGGNVKFTVYPGATHDAWTETYANPEVYRWLLEQKRRQ